MMRTLAALGLVALAALAAVALTLGASVEAPANFRFVNGTEPTTLDPQRLTGQPGGRVVSAIFEGLARYDERSMDPVPGAAEHWSVSADGRRYEFTLRDDAYWSDGTPVTAQDFAWSWRRLQDPSFAAEYAYILHFVRFAEEYNLYGGQADRLEAVVETALPALREATGPRVAAVEWQRFAAEHELADLANASPDPEIARLLAAESGEISLELAARTVGREAKRRRAVFEEASRRFGVDGGVFATGDKRLVVELDAATPYFITLTAFYPMLPSPRWVIDVPGNELDWFLPEKIVTNGPFRLESWRINDKIRLVKSPNYWGRDEVRLERVDVLPTEHQATALNLYLTGGADWLPGSYPSDLVDVLRQRDDFYAQAGLSVYFYKLNTTRPPFDDARVRLAINLAIDRTEIVEEVLRLGQLPATRFVPPGMVGYPPPDSPIGLDVERARRLLAEAGHPEGRGIEEIGILYNTSEGHKKIAEVVADQLRRNLGLDVRAYNQEWQSFLTTVRNLDYDMSRYGWTGDYVDPNTFLDMWLTGGGNNNTGWSHAGFDRLVAAAADVDAFVRSGQASAIGWKRAARVERAIAAVESAAGADGRRLALARLRMEILREAEAILLQDGLPMVPVYFYVNSGLVAPEVRGFYMETVKSDGARGVNLQNWHPLRGIWIDRAARRPRLGG
ncbi:MAG: peptide ABC transporter substrate-binding protein [Myxococcota bacterium]|nr:peptide ABC transporter substrate-binding protein [Myxococcota bacterium]